MIINRSAEDIVLKKEIVICDWDGVIQLLEKAWLYEVKKNPQRFAPYFDFTKIIDIGSPEFLERVMNREQYYLNKWLENKELPQDIFDDFMGIYLNDYLFYQNCPFLSGYNIINTLIENDFCKEIIFLSQTPYEDGKDLRKELIFKEHFGSRSPKASFVSISDKKPKWEWILENKPDYSVMIDDRLDILKDIMMKTDSKMKTYLMPMMGYNQNFVQDKELSDIILENAINLSVYDQKILLDL